VFLPTPALRIPQGRFRGKFQHFNNSDIQWRFFLSFAVLSGILETSIFSSVCLYKGMTGSA